MNKVLEVSLYKQAIAVRGSDAQQMLKSSIDEVIALRAENARLADGKAFE